MFSFVRFKDLTGSDLSASNISMKLVDFKGNNGGKECFYSDGKTKTKVQEVGTANY